MSREQAAARLDHKNGTLNLGDKGLEGETRRWQLTSLAKGLQVKTKKSQNLNPNLKQIGCVCAVCRDVCRDACVLRALTKCLCTH